MRGVRLVLVLIALLACTGQERRLTFWVGGAPQEVAYWEDLVAEFEAQAGIAVDIIRQPAATDQRKQGLVIALEANQPDPDLFLMDIVWITQFVQSEWLRPLDPFFDRGPISPRDFFPRVVAAVDRHGGRIYALPAFLDVGLVFDLENLFFFDKTDGRTLL